MLLSLLNFVLVLVFVFFHAQIVYNTAMGTRKALHPLYYLGTTLTRLFVPLYLLGCPENFMLILRAG